MTKKTIFKVIIAIIVLLLLPAILFEYFVFSWCWFGSGIFSLFAIPVIFSLWLILFIFLKNKTALKENRSAFTKIIIIVLLPILTMAILKLISLLFDVDISVA